jgi:hypothetical protein
MVAYQQSDALVLTVPQWWQQKRVPDCEDDWCASVPQHPDLCVTVSFQSPGAGEQSHNIAGRMLE